jgi:hypothetical protein
LLFLDVSNANIQPLKWLLLEYEDLLEIKLNFNKYELVPFNLTDSEGTLFVEQLICKLSSLPFMYLGIHLLWKKLSVDSWNFLIEKIENKLQ